MRLRAHRDALETTRRIPLTLTEKGIEPEREPTLVREGGIAAPFVRDPDGYRMELIERSDD